MKRGENWPAAGRRRPALVSSRYSIGCAAARRARGPGCRARGRPRRGLVGRDRGLRSRARSSRRRGSRRHPGGLDPRDRLQLGLGASVSARSTACPRGPRRPLAAPDRRRRRPRRRRRLIANSDEPSTASAATIRTSTTPTTSAQRSRLRAAAPLDGDAPLAHPRLDPRRRDGVVEADRLARLDGLVVDEDRSRRRRSARAAPPVGRDAAGPAEAAAAGRRRPGRRRRAGPRRSMRIVGRPGATAAARRRSAAVAVSPPVRCVSDRRRRLGDVTLDRTSRRRASPRAPSTSTRRRPRPGSGRADCRRRRPRPGPRPRRRVELGSSARRLRRRLVGRQQLATSGLARSILPASPCPHVGGERPQQLVEHLGHGTCRGRPSGGTGRRPEAAATRLTATCRPALLEADEAHLAAQGARSPRRPRRAHLLDHRPHVGRRATLGGLDEVGVLLRHPRRADAEARRPSPSTSAAGADLTGHRVDEHRAAVLPARLVLPAPAHDLGDRRARRPPRSPGARRSRAAHDDLVVAEVGSPEAQADVVDRPSPDRCRRSLEVDDVDVDQAGGDVRAVAAGVHPHGATDRAGDADRPLEAP